MVATLTLIVCCNGWQAAQLDLATQGIYDPQHVFQSQGGFACLKVYDEANANPCRES
jgi:hypothetical protein